MARRRGSAGSVSVITAGSVSAYGGRGERGVRYRVIKGWVSGQQWIYFHKLFVGIGSPTYLSIREYEGKLVDVFLKDKIQKKRK